MMNILVFNQGSSSLKWSLYHFSSSKDSFSLILEEKIERKDPKALNPYELKKKIESSTKNQMIDCIGHRIVHGKDLYQQPTFITKKVKEEILSLASLAPLHNTYDLLTIEMIEKLFPKVPQIAVFDTAFHHTLPEKCYTYPGPYEWRERGIRRFGFHGISFSYCAKKAEELLQKKIDKMVICHLGAGASLCAVKEGKSIDTTMGFTPLEGLMMNTRSGSIDPGILLHLLEKNDKKVEELKKELYEQSGLLGLSGISSNLEEVLSLANQKNPRAKLAIDVYLHRLISSIGSMIASLEGLDALIFTGGIGENCFWLREKVCRAFSFLGIDHQKDLEPSCCDQDLLLSSQESKIDVLLIHTKEDLMIAKLCKESLVKVR